MKDKLLFLIGDSISIHYRPYLQQMLKGRWELLTLGGDGEAEKNLDKAAGANGGDSGRVLGYVRDAYDRELVRCPYFLFNCGLHDIKTNPETKEKKIGLEAYQKNLEEILRIMENGKARVLWMNTTPVEDSIHNGRTKKFERYNEDVLVYNAAAESIMKNNGIPVIDLYNFTKSYGPEAYCDHVHFIDRVRESQAAFISGALSILLG